jgi:hypothetical protein
MALTGPYFVSPGANMAKQEPWFIEERAKWFASLVLTKGNDVKVQPYAGSDTGLDLLVEVLKEGRPTMRFFGVQLVPYRDLPKLQNTDGRSLSGRGRDRFEAALPLCVFVIGVRKPEGVYRWVAEPAVEDGRAVLRHETGANWEPLDEAAAARLVGQVNAWYDAVNGGPTPILRGRDSKGA